MSTLDAPEFMGRREVAERLVNDLPAHSDEVVLVFGDEQYPTISFVDEFVRQVLVLGRADRIRFIGPDDFTTELINDAVDAYHVHGRVIFDAPSH